MRRRRWGAQLSASGDAVRRQVGVPHYAFAIGTTVVPDADFRYGEEEGHSDG